MSGPYIEISVEIILSFREKMALNKIPVGQLLKVIEVNLNSSAKSYNFTLPHF
jgi:hypothetical protein